jgi:predicted permease
MRFDDFKYAVRRLVRTPGFTLVAVLSLGLGIGANTAMFSVVNAVLLRKMPVRAPEEVVEVYTSEGDGYLYSTSSYPDYEDLKAADLPFSSVVGSRTVVARMERGDRPEVAFGEVISWDFFTSLGVPMALGRSFLPEEDATPGTHPVVILGYRAWENEFGKDPEILGKSVPLNGVPFTVVGVASEAFTGSFPVLVTSFYAPLAMTDRLMGNPAPGQLARRSSRSMFLKARLAPGATVEQANEALRTFSSRLEELYPETNEQRVMSALPSGKVALHPLVDRALKPVAGLLLVVVGIVLLIACANLSSFLLARAEDRRKEIAMRLALGAGRAALIRQLLVETTLLALLGGVAGIVLADWTLRLLMSFQPPIPIPVSLDVGLDRTVLFFTAGVSLLAGLAFGLVPALQATNPDVAPTLKDEGQGTGKARRFNLRNALVVTQMALSFVLLIGAGLFVRSLQKAQMINPGFDIGPAALIWPMVDLSGYETEEEQAAILRTLEDRLLAHPRIQSLAIADRLPLGVGVQTGGYLLPGIPSETPDGDHDIDNANVMPGYFQAMGVPIVQGRAFQPADLDGPPVVIVSEAFVRQYYPGQDMVGRSIQDSGGNDLRIVGVARDTKVRTLGESPRPYIYETHRFSGMEFVVRGAGTSEELLAAALEVVHEVDPDLMLFEAKTMNEHLALMLFPPRMAALLLSVFGGLALLLSAIGIYGVVSYAVARRTREMGIRISLGASARDVVAMAVRGGMRLVVLGGGIGVALAGAVTWSISGFLYGIGPTDIVTFAAIPLLLVGVALLAAFVPARRASLIDPVRALKSE